MRARNVLFAVEWMPAYRVGFFEALGRELEGRGIGVSVTYGDPPRDIAARRTSCSLEWGIRRANRAIPVGGRTLVWQPVTDQALDSDLVIVDQASRLLLNYWLLAQQRRRRVRFALWGHGINLNKSRSSAAGEWIKRRTSTGAHWWFAYTAGVKARVTALGYPPERITNTQNTGAADSLRAQLDRVTAEREVALRNELGVGEGPLGLFLGSLYPDKRLDYLIAAADRIAAAMPQFQLVIAGDGPGRDQITMAAASRPHILWAGHVDGEQKATLLKSASALLIPGSVGLAIVDGFVAGVPTVATAVPTHGPEIEYLRDGENGRMLPADASSTDYAKTVLDVLRDGRDLRRGAARSGIYSTEAMVGRFAEGIGRALQAPPLQGG